MNEEFERRVLAIFDEIVELPPAERAAAMQKLCGGNVELLMQVQSLEAASRDAVGFLGSPTEEAPSTIPPTALSEGPGTIIGSYKLLQEIGRGGFGVVYMAEQAKPVRRRVALKVIKLGMDTREVVARFEAERQALAMMDHPNIAHVLEAGATSSGRPYFVMELVQGVPITEYCDANHLTTRERLELMVPVCRALQSAHQKGVIHRDLKPSNVMVTLHDGVPVPKVIDFGIAKATGASLIDQTLFTPFHQFVGTPAYMSPEQAEMSGLDVDTRADVYGLGVLLYELLTGTTPVDPKILKAAAYAEMARLIRETEPSKPSTKLSTLGGKLDTVASSRNTDPRKLSQIVRGELDWIVMKALEKDRARRYDTAAALADDLGRYLKGEAVTAGAPGRAYRLKKLIRQHRAAITIAAAVAIALMLGVAGTTVGLVRESRQRRISDALRFTAEQQQKGTQATVDFLTHDVLDKATPYSAQDSKVSDTLVKALIEPSLTTVEHRFKDQPLVCAQIQETLAEVLVSLDHSDLALPQAKSAYETRLKILGDSDVDTLKALNQYAEALRQLDRYDEAAPLAKMFMDKSTAAFGSDDALTLEALGNYAWTLQGQHKFNEAEPFSKLAWDRSEQLLGEGESDTILAMNNYATLLGSLKRYSDAAPLHKRVWNWDTKQMTPDNPHTIEAMMNYTVDLSNLEDLTDAAPLCRDAIERTRRVLGEENRYTCRALTNYAVLLTKQGNPQAAEALAKQAWEGDRRLLSDDHSDTFSALVNYVYILNALQRPEAVPLSGQVWKWLKRRYSDADQDTIQAGENYAIELMSSGQSADAIPILQECVDACRRTRPADDAFTANALSALGHATFTADPARAAEAEGYLREAMGMRSRLYGPRDANTVRSATALANLLDQTGRQIEAANLRAEHGIATTAPASK